MLWPRILSALVLIPVVLGAVYVGGWALTALVATGTLVAADEYWRLLRHAGFAPLRWIGWAAVLGLVVSASFGGVSRPEILTAFLLAALAVQVWQARVQPLASVWSSLALTALGVLYLGWLGSYLVVLRSLPNGLAWSLLALGLTWATDSAAYAAGRLFGRHRLMPRLSPNKTVEGVVGGVSVAIVAAVAAGPAAGLAPLPAALLGLLVAGASIIGDLAESLLKRALQAKDSGRLIPGHGGLLDRVDSLLVVVPLVYYFALAVPLWAAGP